MARPLHDVAEGDAGLRLAGPPAHIKPLRHSLRFRGSPTRVRVRVLGGSFRATAGGGRSYPMRKVEAPLSMTMGVVCGKPAKSVSRSGRYPVGMPAGGRGDGLAGGGGGRGEGFGGSLCRCVVLVASSRCLLEKGGEKRSGILTQNPLHFTLNST
uniref:Uncharacterized protein n=1 Tax=Oryza punctata TaxID=4537 RepID=A0A0E0JJ10_ORYPU